MEIVYNCFYSTLLSSNRPGKAGIIKGLVNSLKKSRKFGKIQGILFEFSDFFVLLLIGVCHTFTLTLLPLFLDSMYFNLHNAYHSTTLPLPSESNNGLTPPSKIWAGWFQFLILTETESLSFLTTELGPLSSDLILSVGSCYIMHMLLVLTFDPRCF